MNLAAVREMARAGRLYPSIVLHGGSEEERHAAAVELARLVLCEAAAAERPCGVCRHCRRIAWPGGAGEAFHPDFQVLERDLKTATSVAATREWLKTAQVAPFEAAGQVFAIAAAESLGGEAANALLKTLEEPATSAPRHFLLLCPSQFDLLPTIRSRSLEIFLGGGEPLDTERVQRLAEGFAECYGRFLETGSAVYLLAAAEVLSGAGGWEDPRASAPWSLTAAAVVEASRRPVVPAAARRRLLALAEELLGGFEMRLRGIGQLRILEGLVSAAGT